MYHVTKHYPHSLGLSVAFRQHMAKSHCQYLHGYALAFTFEFAAMDLKEGWVIDFGGLKPLKEWLVETFDHKLAVAVSDSKLRDLIDQTFGFRDIVEPMFFRSVGMEAFARLAFDQARELLQTGGHAPRVQLAKVTVAEHDGNSASYSEPVHFEPPDFD